MCLDRVTVTGAGGMLGRAVVAAFHDAGFEVIPLDHAALDVTDVGAVRRVTAEVRPRLVINCAAYTDVDRAESEPEKAMTVNALGPRNLALACLDLGVELVHISTDYVFSGSKGEPYNVRDPCDPINAYGKSKARGENHVRSLLSSSYIVRTSWLFGPGGGNFIDTVLELGRDREVIPVVNDQRGCPTFTEDLAGALVELVRTGAYGTYHITNSGSATWYELACLAVRLAGLRVKVVPVSSDAFSRPARRPRNSVLDPFPFKETVGRLLPRWEDAVSRYLLRRVATGAAEG